MKFGKFEIDKDTMFYIIMAIIIVASLMLGK